MAVLILQRAQRRSAASDGDADQADDDGVAFGERFHFGAHRPVLWPATFTYTGWPPFPLSLSTASQR